MYVLEYAPVHAYSRAARESRVVEPRTGVRQPGRDSHLYVQVSQFVRGSIIYVIFINDYMYMCMYYTFWREPLDAPCCARC